ncbi:uncharacterized protein LOC118144910 [Callithrix jacchus]
MFLGKRSRASESSTLRAGWCVQPSRALSGRRPQCPEFPKSPSPAPALDVRKALRGPRCGVRPPDALSHPTVPLLSLEHSAFSSSPFTHQRAPSRSSTTSVSLFPARSAPRHADREQPHSTAHKIQIRPFPLPNPERAIGPAPRGAGPPEALAKRKGARALPPVWRPSLVLSWVCRLCLPPICSCGDSVSEMDIDVLNFRHL